MTERKESVLEAVKLTSVKNEMITQEICMGNDELGLQSLPLAYQQQNIVVEVPVINGEPPAMIHSSTNSGEFGLLEPGKMYEAASQTDQVCKKDEMKQYELQSSILNMQKQERIRRRREQNRFRMRALRASDSEVARRLRENNKFRMRMLRASGSQVAEGIRERNKYRMRELRSAETRVIQKCASTSLGIGEYFEKDQFKLSFCLGERQELPNVELNSLKAEYRSDDNLSPEKNKLTSLVKKQLQDKSCNTIYSEENVSDISVNVSPHGSTNNEDQSTFNSVNSDCHCSSVTIVKNEMEALENKCNSGTREENKMCEVQAAVCCMQYRVLGSTDLETCKHSKLNWRDPCIVHTGREQILDNYGTHFVGEVGQYHRIKIQNDILSKGKCFTHFMRVEELEEQHKLIKGMSLTVSKTPFDIDDQRRQQRERGKLRMRIKRHSETEEEAQRRRERGRLRMRVLRASETEEQAARRRELNRLRMRMKRNSTKE